MGNKNIIIATIITANKTNNNKLIINGIKNNKITTTAIIRTIAKIPNTYSRFIK